MKILTKLKSIFTASYQYMSMQYTEIFKVVKYFVVFSCFCSKHRLLARRF